MSFRVRLFIVAALAAFAFGIGTAQRGALAQDGGGAWETVDIGGQATRLFAPKSGALFASRASGVGSGLEDRALMRSDDGGATWRHVMLAPVAASAADPVHFAVDPISHTTVYASGPAGTFKSDDDATTWQQLPLTSPYRSEPVGWDIVVSPADTAVLYAVRPGSPQAAPVVRRSRDGGQTWEETFNWTGPTGCTWQTDFFFAHPTDPAVALTSMGCRTARSTPRIERSTDQGQTWKEVWRGPIAQGGLGSGRLAGITSGSSNAPTRTYATVNASASAGGNGLLFLKSDDGVTYTQSELLEGEAFGGVGVDPQRADRVYVAVNGANGGEVRRSDDAGATWTKVGDGSLARISDLVVGIDGAMVFVATEKGVARIRLP